MFYIVKDDPAQRGVGESPTQNCPHRPMLVLEVPIMRTGIKEAATIERLPDEAEWLHLLLADIQREIARQPSPSAVERIRSHLLSQLDRPTQAAA